MWHWRFFPSIRDVAIAGERRTLLLLLLLACRIWRSLRSIIGHCSTASLRALDCIEALGLLLLLLLLLLHRKLEPLASINFESRKTESVEDGKALYELEPETAMPGQSREELAA